ncbi:hypothetical protein RvY_17631 [Ramazzottius varieornatus]|uniref:Uncharacterized protein n=1 Tax=Ramazzottius varieornatus TaxID=947166 RepID=A0A1D1W8K2_RAMVA|nr:hypothetical protein RvY_17631 [Ramazzottius varieornatus]
MTFHSISGKSHIFPRTISAESFDGKADRSVLHQHDVGVFWDLRRYHLGHDVVSVESVVLALKYRAGLLKSFCNHWLGLDGLNALVRFAVVCDLPGGGDAALELQRQKIFRAFDDLEMQFSNVGGTNNPSRARREGIGRFVKQFVEDYPRPFLVVISDELQLLQSVRNIVGEAVIVPVISRYYKRGHQTDGLTRHFYNRILANNIVVHPWDVYFYEVIMATQIKGHRYPRNVLQILYSKKRDTGTLKEPLIAWVLSLVLQSAAVHLFYRYGIFKLSP